VAGLKDIASVWNNIKEVDLKPIRDAATYPLKIAVAGTTGVGKHTLAEQMRTDPARPDVHTQTPLALITIDADTPPPSSNLIILLVDATRTDFGLEQGLVKKWSEAGKNVLLFINKSDLVSGNIPVAADQGWQASKIISGSANNSVSLQKEFIPAMLEMLPQLHLALGRQFPLFRVTIAHQLINETCFSNAAYSFSTGLAEIVPVLDLPLNLTDLVVLTKSQAFLAYKLGLLVGFSTRWQDYVTEFGGVIGGGFVWRQAARSLIGLVPGWGIIPKVAVAYSGTYVVGHAILGWYLSGRHLSAKQMRDLSIQAFTRGKEYARKLGEKLPKSRLGKRNQEVSAAGGKKPLRLPQIIIIKKKGTTSQVELLTENSESPLVSADDAISWHDVPSLKRTARKPRLMKRVRPRSRKIENTNEVNNEQICARCGRSSSSDARFCQYCGAAFEAEPMV
jgi:signal recognition particle receptor subunit beta/uncharacterized protein (DUF697 family)